ncbi:transposase [Roseomonas sp. USHLN139]|uniref:transposase n=1 Tax=Roseomonas sp. USHLN139 TaxID=3081298 RepID=UPI003FA6C126
MTARKPHPSDVTDNEGAPVAPYLTLMPKHGGQRAHVLREVFNGWRPIIKTGAVAWDAERPALGCRISRRFREVLITRGIIPSTRSRKIPIPDDKGPYRQRHRIETMSNRLKN